METSEELNIGRYLRLVYKRRYLFVAVLVLVATLGIILSYAMPAKYEATSIVLIERNFLNEALKGITVTPSIDERVKAVSTIMKSRPLVMKVMRDLDLDLAGKTESELERSVQAFQKDTNVDLAINKLTRRDMDMFTVSLKHKNPVIARDYVNTLVRRYIEESISSKREVTYGASRFLSEQVDLMKQKISAIDAEIARLETGREKVAVTAAQIKAAGAQAKLIQLQRRLDELLLQYTANHPEVEKARDELEQLKIQMKTMGTGREVAAGQSAALAAEQTAQSEALRKAGLLESGLDGKTPAVSSTYGKSQKLLAMERDRETLQKIYQDMVAAQGKSEVSSQMEVQDKGGTLRIIEPAVLPLFPVSPDRVKMILFGLLAGIGSGIGLIIVLDSSSKSVKSIDMLKTFGLPVLAVIPHIQDPRERQATRGKDIALYLFVGIYLTAAAAVLLYELHAREII